MNKIEVAGNLFWDIYAFKKSRNVLQILRDLIEHASDQPRQAKIIGENQGTKLNHVSIYHSMCLLLAYISSAEDSLSSVSIRSSCIRCKVPLIPSLQLFPTLHISQILQGLVQTENLKELCISQGYFMYQCIFLNRKSETKSSALA